MKITKTVRITMAVTLFGFLQPAWAHGATQAVTKPVAASASRDGWIPKGVFLQLGIGAYQEEQRFEGSSDLAATSSRLTETRAISFSEFSLGYTWAAGATLAWLPRSVYTTSEIGIGVVFHSGKRPIGIRQTVLWVSEPGGQWKLSAGPAPGRSPEHPRTLFIYSGGGPPRGGLPRV